MARKPVLLLTSKDTEDLITMDEWSVSVPRINGVWRAPAAGAARGRRLNLA